MASKRHFVRDVLMFQRSSRIQRTNRIRLGLRELTTTPYHAPPPVNEQDYLTNKGRVEGVWIFFRHGDRAPSRPLCPSHLVEEEASFWRGKLPKPDTETAFHALSRYFPPDIHPSCNDGQFLDVRRAPFGFLTDTGVEQTRENGLRLFNRYNRHGYHTPGNEEYSSAKDFLKGWDLRVYSTNYVRTIMSVQSFLDGLLGMDIYKNLQAVTNSSLEIPQSAADMRIPNHGSLPPPTDDALLRVQVRGRDQDTLNAFDRNPDLMADLVGEVISSPEFQKRDGDAAPLAARLANILPGLARRKAKPSVYNAAPSGINWIEATDHFVCRMAHDVSFSRFSNFEHDDRVEQTLSALAHQTTAHLAWRFRQWYKSPRLLAAIAAPPLREIAQQLLATPSMAESDRRPFTIYSCHDVTILALLYGIGADFLACDDNGGWRFWPSYASTLVFELVRIHDDDHLDNSHVVRVLLNGKPILSVDQHNRYWDSEGTPVGNGPSRMLLTTDFAEIITNLEKAGGYDRGSVTADDAAKKRDMSNWTG